MSNLVAMTSLYELPEAYLQQQAVQAGLTPDQATVFIRKFQSTQSNRAIAAELNISVNACVQRLGEIYQKFGIEGRGRGKEIQLRQQLMNSRGPTPGIAAANHGPFIKALQPAEHMEKDPLALTRLSQETLAADAQFLRKWVCSLRSSQTTLRQEDGNEMVDDVLESLLQTLPVAVTALAADTPHTKADIVAMVLDRLDQLVLELQPRVEKNRPPQLRFFLQETANPLARSIFAFVLRLRSQLGLNDDAFKPWEVIDNAMEQINQSPHHHVRQKSQGMQAYAQQIRQLCFEYIYQRGHEAAKAGASSSSVKVVAVPPERLRRDLHAVDHALLDLYLVTKQRTEANIDFFHILRTRWLEPMKWGTFSADSTGARNFLGISLAEQWDFEIKALRALRAAYHQYDRDSFEAMYQAFEEKVSKRPITYCQKLFYPPEAAPEDFYKLVAVPRETNKDKDDIWLSNRVWRYATLLAKPCLSLDDLDEIRQLLDDAVTRPGLDFWLREVDHFIAHETEDDPDSLLAVEAAQRAELKKHSIRL